MVFHERPADANANLWTRTQIKVCAYNGLELNNMTFYVVNASAKQCSRYVMIIMLIRYV